MNRDEILALYDRRRAVSRPMANELYRRLETASLQAAAQRLGMMVGGSIVFDSEAEADIIADLCVFDQWTDGENLVGRVLRTEPAPEGTPEREIMEARRDAAYSLYRVERVEPGVGVYVKDLFRPGAETLVVDRGMSMSSGVPMMAMRLLRFPEFAMSTGAGIPVTSQAAARAVLDALQQRFGAFDEAGMAALSPQLWSEFAFTAVKALMRDGQTQQIAYANRPDLAGAGGFARPEPVRVEPRVGRNEPCPCGSGKKFKRCHG